MTAGPASWRGPLVAAAVALLYALLWLGPGTPYDQDRASFFLPYNRILRDAVDQGAFPLWSPAIWGGYAVHAEGQGGFCSPLRWVGVLAADEVAALDLESALLLLLAALSGAYGARWLLDPGPAGEALAGVVWSLGGGLLAVQENPAMQGSFVALPLAWGLARQGRPVALALALSASVLGGYPYGPALIAVTATPLLAWHTRRPLRAVALCLGLTALLGAVQWLPTAELLLRSDRAGGMSTTARAHAEVTLGGLRWLVLPWIPADLRHSAESGQLAYLGLLAVGLAGWGAAGRRAATGLTGAAARPEAQRLARIGAGLALGALAVALLFSSPLGELLAKLPGLGMIRGPNKLFMLVGAVVALLAARGLALTKRPALRWALVGLVALDLGSYGLRRAVIVPRAALRAEPELAERCRGQRLYMPEGRVPLVWGSELPADPARVAAFLAAASPLDANHGVRWGVTHVAGYGPLAPARATQVWAQPSLATLRRAGVTRYVRDPRPRPASPELPVLARTPRWVLHGVEGAVAPARAVASGLAVDDLPAALARVPALPPGQVVVEAPAAALGAAAEQPPGSAGAVEVERWVPGRIELALALERRGLVVILDAYDPNWEAELDGQPAPVYAADGLWKAVAAGPGAQRLTLVYRPAAFRWGLALSALGLVCLLGVTFRARRATAAAQSVDDRVDSGLGSASAEASGSASSDEPEPPPASEPTGADDEPHP